MKLFHREKKLSVVELLMFLIGLIIFASSCVRREVILHPVTNEDYYVNGDFSCFSNWYLNEIMQVRIEGH